MAAARDAGYGVHTARDAKEKIESKPAVQALFAELLRKAGATDELLAKRVFEGLNANSVARETKYARREILVDFGERREMTELALRLKGHLIDKHEVRVTRTLEEILDESNATQE